MSIFNKGVGDDPSQADRYMFEHTSIIAEKRTGDQKAACFNRCLGCLIWQDQVQRRVAAAHMYGDYALGIIQ